MTVRPEVVEEAEFIRLQGGEMPEVAMYDSLNQLSRTAMTLTGDEVKHLEKAVLDRYMAIIRRDLEFENRLGSAFRGPERARVNLGRMIRFAGSRGFDIEADRRRTAGWLQEYMRREAAAVGGGRDWNTMGMDRDDLAAFMRETGLDSPEARSLVDRINAVRTLDFQAAIAACRAEVEEGRPV